MELPTEDQEPLSAIAADVLWLMYEAVIMHDYTWEEIWRIAFAGTDWEHL